MTNIFSEILKSFTILVYLIVFISVSYYLSGYLLKKDNKFNLFYISIISTFYFIIIILDYDSSFLSYTPDIYQFEDIIKNIPIDMRGIDQGLYAYKYLILVPKYLFYLDPNLFKIFNAFITFITGFLIWKAYELNVKEEKMKSVYVQRIFLLMYAFYPPNINYGIKNLRDCYVVFFFSLLLILISYKEKQNYILKLIVVIIIVLLRGSYIIFLPIFFVDIEKIKIIKNKIYRFLLLLIVVGIGVMLFLLLFKIKYNKNFSLSFLIYLRNHRQLNPQFSYPNVNWKTWFDAIKGMVLLIAQFILYPYSVIEKDKNLFFGFFAMLEGLYLPFILLPIVSFFKHIKINIRYLSIIIIGILMSGVYEYFYSAIIRHRYPFYNLLIPITAFCIFEFLNYCGLIKRKGTIN